MRRVCSRVGSVASASLWWGLLHTPTLRLVCHCLRQAVRAAGRHCLRQAVAHRTSQCVLWSCLALGILAASHAAAAQPQAESVELWYVSTRSLDECDLDSPQPGVFRSDVDGGWSASTLEAVTNAGDAPIVLLVHGNRADADGAVDFAWPVYDQLRELGGRCRLVIWAWPADRDPRPSAARRGGESGAGRHGERAVGAVRAADPADDPGRHDRLQPRLADHRRRLHLLHGESYAGRSLPGNTPAPRTPMRIVLAAGAMDQDALCTAEGDAPKWSDVQRILVTENHADRVLRWYPRMNRGRRGPAALGFAGPGCCDLPPEQLESVDLTCEIGRRHAWMYYAAAPSLRQRLPWYAFVE